MIHLVALYLAIVSPPTSDEVNAFRATAPDYLTTETARVHLIVARAAARVHHVRPELLLAIAFHESRYIPTTRTKEPGHRESCGVMTPVPKQRCRASDLTVVGGYEEGAAHLRTWLEICHGNEVCALLAYAGGRGLARACRNGHWATPRGSNACDIPWEFRKRADTVRHAINRR